MDPALQRLVDRLPPIDERARQANLAMTNANYVFIGGEVSWARSARFSHFYRMPLQAGTLLRVTFHEGVFTGRLATRLCLWGDEEYLECPLPREFATLVAGPFRRAIDVATNIDGQLVMTFSPGADYVSRGETSLDRLALARDLEILTAPPAADPAPQLLMNTCPHAQTEEITPDPTSSFLQRTFTICMACGRVLARRGRCARDACDCSRHGDNFRSVPVAAGG